MKNIAAIIVTYNPEVSILHELVHSLEDQVGEVFLIDNDSNNISYIFNDISQLFVTPIVNSKNIGLAAAQNIGISLAKNKGFTDIVLFDQDSQVSVNFIKDLVEQRQILEEKNIQVSAIGPTLVDRDSLYKYPATMYKGIFKKRPEMNGGLVETTFTISSGSLISIDTLDRVGSMDEKYFIDYIDVEWCIRAKKFGFKSFMSSDVEMLHDMGDKKINILGKKFSLHSDFRCFYIFRNGCYLLRTEYVPYSYKRLVLFNNVIRFFLNIYASDKKIKTIKRSINGWWHGFFDNIEGIK